MSSILIGLAGGIICFFAIKLKERFGYDDSLDVVGIHMVGGIVGGLLIGVLASDAAFSGEFEEAGGTLMWNQFISIVVVLVYSFIVTFVIAKVLDATIGLRVSDEAEQQGLDSTEHGETGYISDGTFNRV